MALRHIICTIFALMPALSSFSQTSGTRQSETDSLMNRYELICRDCIDMKTMVSSGKSVPKKHAIEMIDRFVELNSLIRSRHNSLTPEQLIRFEAINKWFSTGTRPLALDHMRMETVSAIDMPEPRLELTDINVVPAQSAKDSPKSTVISKKKTNAIILADISVPDFSYGAMIGLQKGKWGGFIKFRSNYLSTDHSYTCKSNGTIGSASPFWSNGKSTASRLTACGGLIYGFTDWLNLYAGAGYGHSKLFWQDIDNKWALVQDCSFKGVAVELGLTASWKMLTVGAGVSSINLRTATCDILLGICF